MSVNDLVSTEVKPWMNINVFSMSVNGGSLPFGDIECQERVIPVILQISDGSPVNSNMRISRIGDICYLRFDETILNTGGASNTITCNTPLSAPFLELNTKSFSQAIFIENTTLKPAVISCITQPDGGSDSITIQTLDAVNFAAGNVKLDNICFIYNVNIVS